MASLVVRWYSKITRGYEVSVIPLGTPDDDRLIDWWLWRFPKDIMMLDD